MIAKCSGCQYLGSDAGYESFWYVCDHPCAKVQFGDWGTLPMDVTTPDWCPINNGGDADECWAEYEAMSDEEQTIGKQGAAA